MIDFKTMFEATCEIGRNERKKYHLTLEKLIKILKDSQKDLLVKFDNGCFIGDFNSYRGYYSDLSIEPIDINNYLRVNDFINKCEESLNQEFEGYKGGQFLMAGDTPLWMAEYGKCGDSIIDAIISDNSVILITKKIED
jgi:hypothetical protein